MQFIDEATLYAIGGDGGNGCVAFRREKYIPRGGPAGGDGGAGGSVILVADPQLGTLLDIRYQQRFVGQRGEHGGGHDRFGRGGDDREVPVPVGTLVKDFATGEVLADLATAGSRFVAAKGGRGGRGNLHFATSTNQAPRRADPGDKGEERKLRLELKLLADVGLLGYPNVGKSTFISRVSKARPKIADYPFTTLTPHLGVVALKGERNFVLADIPGLIEGAAEGAGLGHRFLKHVERTGVLLHLVERSYVEGRDPLTDYLAIRRELARYDEALSRRPEVVALTKLDLPDTREALPALREAFATHGVTLHAVSSATGEGVDELLEKLWPFVTARRAAAAAEAQADATSSAEAPAGTIEAGDGDGDAAPKPGPG